MKKTCQCGTCEWCEAKKAVLAFASAQQWAPFIWTVFATIGGGEENWNIFVNAHELADLRWVLRVIGQQSQTQAQSV